MWVAVCLVLSIFWLFYYFWIEHYQYWKKRGFPDLPPKFPFGNLKDWILFRRYQGHVLQDLYNEGEPHSYVGLFALRRPQLLMRDPDIIKYVMVKDFAHFRDRLVVKRRNETLADNLFSLYGDKWRSLRVKLTPTFTSGKLKNMYPLFEDCAEQLDQILDQKAEAEEIIDVKSILINFTCDIIVSCAFGLELNSVKSGDNEFINIVGKILPVPPPLIMKLILAFNNIFPGLENILQLELFPKKISDFILSTITHTVDYREKNNIKRNDFLDLLLQLKNKGKLDVPVTEPGEEKDSNKAEPIEMTMNLLAAQCLVFLLAGFETSSSVQSYCMYELAINPDIQERLRKEIDEVTAKHGGLTYQSIQEMDFLDQVVSETIRKYPTLPILHRTCSKKYTMPDTGLVVEEGTRLIIPVYALHHDPKYFPDPEKFDPDRFSPERKKEILPFSYLPFGEGPRLCIGMRFGLLQTKMGLCTMLRKYKLSRCGETKVPVDFTSSNLITATEGAIKLKIQRRPQITI